MKPTGAAPCAACRWRRSWSPGRAPRPSLGPRRPRPPGPRLARAPARRSPASGVPSGLAADRPPAPGRPRRPPRIPAIAATLTRIAAGASLQPTVSDNGNDNSAPRVRMGSKVLDSRFADDELVRATSLPPPGRAPHRAYCSSPGLAEAGWPATRHRDRIWTRPLADLGRPGRSQSPYLLYPIDFRVGCWHSSPVARAVLEEVPLVSGSA